MRGTKKWGISAVHRGQVTVSASEFDASILDGDVGNPVGKCCEKNKGVDSICLLLEEAVTTSNRFSSLRIACFHFDGFWMQVEPGRPVKLRRSSPEIVHLGLDILRLKYCGHDEADMIWLYLTIKLKLLNFVALGPWGQRIRGGPKDSLLNDYYHCLCFKWVFFVQNSMCILQSLSLPALGLIEAWLSPVKPLCWACTTLGATNYHSWSRVVVTDHFPIWALASLQRKKRIPKAILYGVGFTVIQE